MLRPSAEAGATGRDMPALWYLPADVGRTDPVHGTYRVQDNGSVAVTIVVENRERSAQAKQFFSAARIEPIHGSVIGTPVTLVHPVLTRMSRGPAPRVFHLVSGVAIQGPTLKSEIFVESATASFIDLNAWSGWRGYTSTGAGDDTVYSEIPMVVASGRVEGDSVEIYGGSRMTYGGTDLHLDLDTGARFVFGEPIPFETLATHWIEPLEFLISTATGRRAGISHLRLFNAEWTYPDRSSNDEFDPGALTLWGRPPDVEDIRHSDFLLHHLTDWDLNDFGRISDAYRSHPYAIALFERAREEATDPNAGLTTFMTAIQALEALARGLHGDASNPRRVEEADEAIRVLSESLKFNHSARKRLANALRQAGRLTLPEHLRRLDTDAGALLEKNLDEKEWAEHLAQFRNIVAHGLEQSKALVEDLRALNVATTMAQWLFEARWLRLAGLSTDAIIDLYERRIYRLGTRERDVVNANYHHLKTAIAARANR